MLREIYILVSITAIVRLTVGQYYGTEVGALSTNDHSVSGTVYIVDSRHLWIRNFNYDGTAPDAFFWIGNSVQPDGNGMKIPDEAGSTRPLLNYINADLVLTLPVNNMVTDITWIAVWCKQFGANFGSIQLPNTMAVPAPHELGALTGTSGGVSSTNVIILDTKRFRIESFIYTASGQVANFYVGSGAITAANGVIVPNEKGSIAPLFTYTSKHIVITLPDGKSMSDIDWLSVSTAGANLGSVMVPNTLTVPPYTDIGYYGEHVGNLDEMSNGVQGTVYVVDNMRVRIRHFTFDGACSGAYFYIGKKGVSSDMPSAGGIKILNERQSPNPLGAYSDKDVILKLPVDMTVAELSWLSVWCTSSTADLGSILFPTTITVPNKVSIGEFSELAHGTSSGPVYVLDKRTIQIQELHYDGYGPDAFFLAGAGSPNGNAAKVADEDGSLTKAHGYTGQTIQLILPGGLTVDDVDFLSLYCIRFTENFGQVDLDNNNYFVPPYVPEPEMEPLENCEPMNDNFNVGWQIMDQEIMFEFTGALDDDNGYMAFGISGSTSSSAMIGADPMVVYLDNGQPTLADYTINKYSLCSGDQGVCPDTEHTDGNENLEILYLGTKNGVTTVRFKRMLDTGDGILDKTISTSSEMYVVWAMGNVNSENQVTKHKQWITGNKQLNFGRTGAYNCEEIIGEEKVEVTPWEIQTLSGKDVQEFTAVIGPTGGKRGYEGITGQVSWGISWYINGLIIPEITVKRGETYTFHVGGGNDPSNQAKYHPLYITNDPVGGYDDKTEAERQGIQLLAGTNTNDTGVYGTEGNYCEYEGTSNPENFETFEGFKATLNINCQSGDNGMFTWNPDASTPDLVYYQCFTHNYLGWKIHVVDNYSNASPAVRAHIGPLVSASIILLAMLFME